MRSSLVDHFANLDDESLKQRQANSPVSIHEMIMQGERVLMYRQSSL